MFNLASRQIEIARVQVKLPRVERQMLPDSFALAEFRHNE